GNFLGEKFDGAGVLVTNDDEVGVHRVQRHRRVDQRLALLHGGGGDRHVHDVGAEALARQLEGALGAGGGLEEEIDLGAAAKDGALLVDLAVLLDIGVGEVEKARYVGGGKALYSQQMPVREEGLELFFSAGH